MNLDRKTITKAWQKINKLKRVGHKVTDTTIVMRINVMKDGEVEKVQDITYKNIKKYLRKI